MHFQNVENSLPKENIVTPVFQGSLFWVKMHPRPHYKDFQFVANRFGFLKIFTILLFGNLKIT